MATRSSYLWFLAASLLAGCGPPALPVWYVPADSDLSAAEVESKTNQVLSEMGYEIENVDPRLAMISTRWQHDSRLLSTRSRVELRLKPTAPYGVALTVPQQVHDGHDWIPDGEEQRRRQLLVASLTARLTARPAAPVEGKP